MVPPLLSELDRYGDEQFEIDVVSEVPVERRERAMAAHSGAGATRSVRQIEMSPSEPDVLESLEPHRYDDIIRMASERLGDQDQADALSVFTYLKLEKLLEGRTERPHLLVELQDENDRFLFDDDRADVIVSPTFVSQLFSQTALRPEVGTVVSELSPPLRLPDRAAAGVGVRLGQRPDPLRRHRSSSRGTGQHRAGAAVPRAGTRPQS